MRTTRWLGAAVLGFLWASWGGLPPGDSVAWGQEYPDPARFEAAIQGFETADQRQPPPTDGVVCTGSSSMRMWHSTIAADLAPLAVIPRGFGGSNMNDLLFYADRVILRYRPRAVVLYEGDNDVAQGIPPEKIHATFNRLTARIWQARPDTRIYFLAIKPSVARASLWPQAVAANRLIATTCAADPRLTYVDVATPMLQPDGQVRPDLFLKDNLHMNRTGYEIWRDQLRPILRGQESGTPPPAPDLSRQPVSPKP